MISVLKNDDGYVTGYIEWEIVNKDGQFENNGKYIYIQNVWIHPQERKTEALRDLAVLINKHPYSQKATHVYWELYKDKDNKKILENEEREWIYENKRIYQKDYILNKFKNVSFRRSEVPI